MFINNQESYVTNGANTTKFFPFKRIVRHGYPIADMFILRLEVLFILIKSDPNIKGKESFCIVTFIQPMQATQPFFK